jgi:hypothetical protein
MGRTRAGVTVAASASRSEAGEATCETRSDDMGFTTEPNREVTYEPREMPVPAVPAPVSVPAAPSAPRREPEPVPAR